MITEQEKRQILLAEWLQKKAEDDFWAGQRKKAIKKTIKNMEEEYEREHERFELSVYEAEMVG